MKTLKDLFLDELGDIYDAERRTAKAFTKMAKATTCDELKGTILSHQKEAEAHMTKIGRVFDAFDTKTRARTCGATIGILEEGDELMEDYKGSPAINAGLICLVQKIKNHEMAHYGCLHEWAGELGNTEAARILHEILEEEEAANEAFANLRRADREMEAHGEVGKEVTTKTVASEPTAKPAPAPIVTPTPSRARRKTAPTLL